MKNLLFFILVVAIQLSPCAQLPSYLPTDGLLGWWPFNGNANDESGNDNHGTVNGATLTSDRFNNTNQAFNFDGLNDVITTSFPGILGGNSRSVSFWAKQNQTNTSAGSQIVLGWGGKNCGPSGIATGFYCAFNVGSSGISIDANESSTTYNTLDPVSDNNWHHYVFVKDQQNLPTSQVKIYQDGILLTEITGSYISNGTINTLAQTNLTFGSRGFSCVPDRFYEGASDDIGIWNRVLTPEEITNIFTFSSSNNNPGGTTSSHVPAGIHYQAIARNTQGMPIIDSPIQVKFTFINGSPNGTTEYAELHSLTTNSLGLFSTNIGTGTVESGTFESVNWSNEEKYLKVECNTGNEFIELGTQQLMSVPFAMRAQSAFTAGSIENVGLPVFSDNTAALAGGMQVGQMYRTSSGFLMIVF